MNESIVLFTAAALPVLAGASATALRVAWNVGRRVERHETLFEERAKQQAIRDDDIVARLERIERKQDAANGHAR